jgi:hypothetical protein
MAHSVIITTPMPTLDEIGEELGLKKSEQDSLIRLVDKRISQQKKTSDSKAPNSTVKRKNKKSKKKK